MTLGAGLAPEQIGDLYALTSLGTALFLAFGSPFLRRWGPVRTMQAGLLVAAASLGIASIGWWAALAAAALLLGVGYGPTPPAGSRILAATAPPRHQTLIFSIKQAGAPAGGALAGLMIAPAAVAFGWPAALLLAVLTGVLTCLVVDPLRRMMDTERDAHAPIGFFHVFRPRTVLAPMTMMRQPRMLAITALAVSFAIVQGCLFSFTVTYLVTDRGLALAQAGLAYAVLQAAGVVARILLGWLADRTGRPAHNLTVQAFIAAGLVVSFAVLPVDATFVMVTSLCAAVGFFAASWNGIYLAEVARLAPPDRVADATSASLLFTFIGYIIGPALFTWLVQISGGWHLPFVVIAAQLAVMALLQSALLLHRRYVRP
jgi:MFS family permease